MTSIEEIDYIPLNIDIQQLITAEKAWHYSVVPKLFDDNSIQFYIDENKNIVGVQEELELIFGKNISLINKPAGVIKKTLGKYYFKQSVVAKKEQYFADSDSQDFLLKLIKDAREVNSSDIHFESDEDTGRIRFRIDGLLVDRYLVDKDNYPRLINKIKNIAKLDISEQRMPQDGRIQYNNDKLKFDIRVSIIPSIYNECAVLRLLSNDTTNIDIYKLGLNEAELNHFLKAVQKSKGLVLLSGPTGSGKTTTLYGTLKLLNKTTRKILTVEDPVEYTLKRVIQVPVNESIGLTFAKALRTFLRQDPDVIMVGEIRDEETAQIATRAASTGHLVLSSIHANSAWGSIPRLIDIGIPAYHIADTLNIAIAQRLLRKPCPHCSVKKEFVVDEKLLDIKLPKKIKHHVVAVGCEHCKMTGYSGRQAIYEVIPVDKKLQSMIRDRVYDISEYMKEKDIKTLAENAFQLLEKGETTFEEIYHLMLEQS